MIVEPSLDNGSQPLAHVGHRVMQQTPKLRLDIAQLRPHPPNGRLTLERKHSLSRLPAVVRETEKVKCFRLTPAPACPTFRREAPELDQPGFLRVQLQAELQQSPPQLLE